MKNRKSRIRLKFFDFWNFYSRIYDVLRTFSPYKRMQAKVITNLRVISHLSIADVSCGTGNTLQALMELKDLPPGLDIIGLDQSSAMLERARRKLKRYPMRLSSGNYDNLGQVLGDKKMDRIISVNSLYCCSDPETTLKHWWDNLNDGGLAIVVNPFIPKQWPVLKEFFKSIQREKDFKSLAVFIALLPVWLLLMGLNAHIAHKNQRNIYHFLEPQQLKALAESTGFRILSEEIVYGGGSILLCLQKDAGGTIRRAQTPEEVGRIQKLRYNIYCKEINSVSDKNISNGLEIDRFDPIAVHFMAVNNGEVVGSARVIPDLGAGFLLEEYFMFPDDLNRKITLEISRAALSPENRGDDLFIKLIDSAVEYGLKHGYKKFIGASTARIWEKFKKSGWTIKIWTPYIKYHNTIAAAAIIEPPSSQKNE